MNKSIKSTIELRVAKSNFAPKISNPKMRGVDVDTARMKYNQPITPLPDGAQKVFTTPDNYVSGTLGVYKDGLRQIKTADYTETSANTFTMVVAPDADVTISVDYVKAL